MRARTLLTFSAVRARGVLGVLSLSLAASCGKISFGGPVPLPDTGVEDVGPPDLGPPDVGPPDIGPPPDGGNDCIPVVEPPAPAEWPAERTGAAYKSLFYDVVVPMSGCATRACHAKTGATPPVGEFNNPVMPLNDQELPTVLDTAINELWASILAADEANLLAHHVRVPGMPAPDGYSYTPDDIAALETLVESLMACRWKPALDARGGRTEAFCETPDAGAGGAPDAQPIDAGAGDGPADAGPGDTGAADTGPRDGGGDGGGAGDAPATPDTGPSEVCYCAMPALPPLDHCR